MLWTITSLKIDVFSFGGPPIITSNFDRLLKHSKRKEVAEFVWHGTANWTDLDQERHHVVDMLLCVDDVLEDLKAFRVVVREREFLSVLPDNSIILIPFELCSVLAGPHFSSA